MAARIVAPPPGEPGAAGAVLDEWLRVPAPHRAAERLRVYQDGYPARVHDALAEAYPVVAHLLGEEAFGTLARRYAASVPLGSYNLNDAGARLPEFLRRDALGCAQPFLSDLAQLEWCVAAAFHAAERPPLDPRALGWSVDQWASAVLHFQPSVAVVSSPWPILDLWAAREQPSRPVEIDASPRPAAVVIRRAGFIVRCESVSAHEALALRLLLAGHSLSDTIARLAVVDDTDAVLAWFSRWTGAGMIAAAETSEL
jgi:hypothetical protein